MDLFVEARRRMVDEQVAGRGIRDERVLAAMRSVPRHEFVPPASGSQAYDDCPLPIGEGQTISQPYMVALMTAALALPNGARVLEIGTGSGYQAAVLSTIASEVITVERHEALATSARDRLRRLHYDNVRVIVGDGTRGLPDLAPFHAIIVTAGAPAVPASLRSQLVDGGRLVIPVGNQFLQHLTVITRSGDRFEEHRQESCAFVPLIGAEGWPEP